MFVSDRTSTQPHRCYTTSPQHRARPNADNHCMTVEGSGRKYAHNNHTTLLGHRTELYSPPRSKGEQEHVMVNMTWSNRSRTRSSWHLTHYAMLLYFSALHHMGERGQAAEKVRSRGTCSYPAHSFGTMERRALCLLMRRKSCVEAQIINCANGN